MRDSFFPSQKIIEHLGNTLSSDRDLQLCTQCVDSLDEYLLDQGVCYNPETAEHWFEHVLCSTNASIFFSYHAALRLIKEILCPDNCSRLPPWYRNWINRLPLEFIECAFILSEKCNSSKFSTQNIYRLCDCKVFKLLYERLEIIGFHELDYEKLIQLYHVVYGEASDSSNLSSSIRRILYLLVDLHFRSRWLKLLPDVMACPKSRNHWNLLSNDEIETQRHNSTCIPRERRLLIAEIADYHDVLKNELEMAHYGDGDIHVLEHVTNMLIVFLDMHQLEYCAEIGNVWLQSMRPFLTLRMFNSYRRIIGFYDDHLQGMNFDPMRRYGGRGWQIEHLPTWCRDVALNYIQGKRKEGMANSSVCMISNSISRLLKYADKQGIHHFEEIDTVLLKAFNRDDIHATPQGKNAYNSIIRKFLIYLADEKIVSNPSLFMSLPCVFAQSVHNVTTLSEEEQLTLNTTISSDSNGISLRSKAILHLGIHMGMRRIDIVRLTIDEIDWDQQMIRLYQAKTKYEVDLPMPDEVGNALYRYIVEERPHSDDPHVFLSEDVPHHPMKPGICMNAICEALPERQKGDFHITRRTFATNRLERGAEMDEIIELLGHQDRSSVHKYLSTNSEIMRMCPISLKELGLKNGGLQWIVL